MYDYSRSKRAGEDYDDAMKKSLEAALDWLARLEKQIPKAKAELKSKKEPGREMSTLVGQVVRVEDEDWHSHWFA